MGATVLFYGPDTHAGLRRLYRSVQERGRCQALYVALETFPGQVPVVLGAGPGAARGHLAGNLLLDDVVAACIDGLYVAPEQSAGLDEKDRAFAQTELWSTLIALFGSLSRSGRVANLIVPRDALESRLALLTRLARHGVAVPRTLVTSQPEAAQDFFERLEGRVICRTVAYTAAAPVYMTRVDLARLAAIRLSPIHFEEACDGSLHTVAVVNARLFDRGADIPAELRTSLLRFCATRGLRLAEITLAHRSEPRPPWREGGDPRDSSAGWVFSDLRQHLSVEDADVIEAAATWLESGA